MIRVGIADDHTLIRQGIRVLLEKCADLEIVGEAADGQEAVDLVRAVEPDVLVMDIVMPRLNGTQALDQLKRLHVPTRVVILSMHSDETLIYQALQRGAKGYLLKSSVVEELLLAIHSAYRNEVYLSPGISKVVLSEYLTLKQKTDERTPFESLTPRECEVLQLIGEGHTNSIIALKLCISEKTVEKHRASLMAKLDIHDLAGLIRYSIKNGLIDLEN